MTALGIIASAHVETGGGGFDPLSIPWHTAYWAGASSWSHPADGAAVSQWDDATGNTRHAIQTAVPARQPLYRASVAALNNKPAVDFVSTDALSTATWTAVAQPWSLVVVAHLRSVAVSLIIVDGDDATHRAIIGISTTSLWRFASGTAVNSALTNDTNAHLFVGGCTTSSSAFFEVDGGAPVTATGGNHTNTGLTLGAGNSETASNIAGEIAFTALYPGDVRSHANWTAFENWVETEYGITVA